jgi:membrane fusion protein, multidrug efflux system
MKTYSKIVILVSLSAIVAGACSKKQETGPVEKIIAVQAQVIQSSNEDVVKTFTGSLEGERQAVLYSKLAEAVDKVRVHEGQNVRQDEILMSLDKFGASTRYSEVLSRLQNAEKTYKKMEYLFKEGAISESQHDDAKTAYEVARANLDAVQRMIEVSSPIDGTVTSVDVSPGDFVGMGQKLATVATVKKLRIKFGVNAASIGFFAKGADVTITSDMIAQTGQGKVTAVAESADPMNRSFQVEALIDNAEGYFRPGMFVKVNIVQERLNNVLTVPRTAVITLDNKYTVFTAVNGIARKHEITLGQDLDGRVVAISGLAVGDTLITLGQTYLEDGYKVSISSAGAGSK